MYMNPNLLDQLAKDHQRQLLREAEMERLARQARMERPTLSMRLRLLASGLLSHVGRSGQSRTSSQSEQSGAPASAHNA